MKIKAYIVFVGDDYHRTESERTLVKIVREGLRTENPLRILGVQDGEEVDLDITTQAHLFQLVCQGMSDD